ncbi:MAG: YegS/Rv2252/BmrU family lipid kinase [Lachnospiraceae bacterium]|nr:YegS/Rv2252/BmrU family lipid kinase [Lachnospiraceae bacterium]
MLPKDPEMLYSMINLKLRDQYSSLHALCDDMDEDEEAIVNSLQEAGYVYDADGNRFMPAAALAKEEKTEVSVSETQEEETPIIPEVSPYKRVLLIVNPRSGVTKKGAALNDIIITFSEHGYETTVCFTRKAGDGTQLVLDHANEAVDIICCMGGDGTLNEMITGARKINWTKPMGYIPAGSTNDFAASRGIPVDPAAAAERIMTGEVHYMDLGEFNGRTYVYTAANGLFSSTTYTTPQSFKNRLGHFAYVLEAAKDVFTFKPVHLKVDTGEEVFEGKYIFTSICNTFSMGGVMSLEKAGVDFSDGLFEMILVEHPSDPIELHTTVQALVNQNFEHKSITIRKISHATIYNEEALDWSLDGERGKGMQENSFRVLHKAVALIY